MTPAETQRAADEDETSGSGVWIFSVGAQALRSGDLNQPKLHFPGFADHVLVPGRLPNQFNRSFVYAGYG
jgi:hypothetical protein